MSNQGGYTVFCSNPVLDFTTCIANAATRLEDLSATVLETAIHDSNPRRTSFACGCQGCGFRAPSTSRHDEVQLACAVVTYILKRSEYVASYQRVMLTKHSFPVTAFAFPVRKRLTKKGPDPMRQDPDMKDFANVQRMSQGRLPQHLHDHQKHGNNARDGHVPKFPDCPVCVEEHGSVVSHFASTSSSLHTHTFRYWILLGPGPVVLRALF